MTAGPELREAREIADLTQEDLAQELGVRQATVSVWEGKAAVKPSKAKRYLEAIARLSRGKAA